MKMLPILTDRLLLIGTGLICAALAWLFWWYFQATAFEIFTLYFMIMLLVENRRLRRALRNARTEKSEQTAT